jgi:hypothetical protein
MIFDRAARDLYVIERDGVICELLIIFVPFACNQHNVARASERNGAIDRLGAIDNLFIIIRVKTFSVSATIAPGSSLRGLSEVMIE